VFRHPLARTTLYFLATEAHRCEQFAERLKCEKLRVTTFIYRHLQGNPNSSGLPFEMTYWQH